MIHLSTCNTTRWRQKVSGPSRRHNCRIAVIRNSPTGWYLKKQQHTHSKRGNTKRRQLCQFWRLLTNHSARNEDMTVKSFFYNKTPIRAQPLIGNFFSSYVQRRHPHLDKASNTKRALKRLIWLSTDWARDFTSRVGECAGIKRNKIASTIRGLGFLTRKFVCYALKKSVFK